MVFKRNREWAKCKVLSEYSDAKYGQSRWISDKPLFISGNKGLYPIFKTGGPTGAFPKNHQEFILRDISDDLKVKKEEDNEFRGL